MDGEGAVSVMCLRCEVNKTALPVVDGVVCCHVPVIVCHAVESQLRCLSVLHWVRKHTACHLVRDVVLQSVGRTLHDDVKSIVSNGEVPPVICRTLDA